MLRTAVPLVLVAALGVGAAGAGTTSAEVPLPPRVMAVLPSPPAAAPMPAPEPVPALVAPAVGSGWAALDAAVARIPGAAGAAPATWEVSDRYGHLGSTLLPAGVVTISPRVTASRLDAVVRHEWAHVLQARAYSGDTVAMRAGLDAVFGGPGASGVRSVERAADCMARTLGADWTHYTSCTSPAWQAAADLLLAGQPL